LANPRGERLRFQGECALPNFLSCRVEKQAPWASNVRFSVERSFKGAANTEVILSRGGSSCDYQFVQSETYLIFAYLNNGVLEATKCARPLPLSQATEAVKYLEGLRANRPQALLYGLALRGGMDQNGNSVLQGSRERLIVRAETAGMSVETRATETDEYELVLSPGQYRVWLVRNGEPVSAPVSLNVAAGDTSLRILSTFPGQ